MLAVAKWIYSTLKYPYGYEDILMLFLSKRLLKKKNMLKPIFYCPVSRALITPIHLYGFITIYNNTNRCLYLIQNKSIHNYTCMERVEIMTNSFLSTTYIEMSLAILLRSTARVLTYPLEYFDVINVISFRNT